MPGTLGERDGESGEKENKLGETSADSLAICANDDHGLQPPSGPCLENSELEEAVAAGVGCVGPALWVVGSRLSPSYLPGPLKKSSLAMGPFWAMHHPLPPSPA